MTNAPCLRVARGSDAHGIARVHVLSWQRAYRGIMPDSVLDGLSIDARRELWEQKVESSSALVLVAEERGSVIGFSACELDGEGPSAWRLVALYLDPERWGGGAGRALHDYTLDRLLARGANRVSLWVARENARARRFYERAGLAPDGATERLVFGDREIETLRYARDL